MIGNCKNKDLVGMLEKISKEENINSSNSAKVLIARDTRPSSERLSQIVHEGVKCAGGDSNDYGLLTTPQLHYIVSYYNKGQTDVNEDDYYRQYAKSFQKLINETPVTP